MQLPEIRNCVAFVTYQNSNGAAKIAGTGFFIVYQPLAFVELSRSFFITARHVIERASRNSADGIVRIRGNHKDKCKGLIDVETSLEDWVFHRDDYPYIDVAALPSDGGPEMGASLLRVCPEWNERFNNIADPQYGDKVFLPGLFSRHPGKKRNIPVMRSGIIAALPEEPIDTEEGDIHGFIIEVHSVGGLSGSPVLREYEVPPWGEDDEGPRGIDYDLLGILSASWKRDDESDPDIDARSLSLGMAIVIPLSTIIDVIDPDMKDRYALEEEVKRMRER